MSLTNSSALRSVNDDGKTPPGSEGVPAVTIMEQVDQIMDAMFGPTAYSGVAKLNRAAEYCSDRAMIAATEMGGAQECESYAQACLILQTLADSLDACLVESFLEADHA